MILVPVQQPGGILSLEALNALAFYFAPLSEPESAEMREDQIFRRAHSRCLKVLSAA